MLQVLFISIEIIKLECVGHYIKNEWEPGYEI